MAKDTPLDEFQAQTLRTLQAWAEPDHEITQPEAFLTQALLADDTQDETDRDQGGEDIARSAGRRQWLSSHGLLGIVAALVSQGDSLANRPGTSIPNLVPWQKIRRESLLRSLKMEAAALTVANAFKGWGGDWAIMKGFGLARRVYDSPYMRPSADIDILVSPKGLESALESLVAVGAKPGSSTMHPHEHSLAFRGVHLDIHNAPMRVGRLRFNPSAEWLSRSQTRGPFPYLSEHDELVLSLVHPAVTEYLGRTIRMLDILLQVRRNCQPIDWERVAEDVTRLGLANAAYVTGIKVNQVFPSQVKPVVPHSFLNGLKIGGMRRHYWRLWVNQGPGQLYKHRPNLARLLFSIWLNDTPRDWTRAILNKHASA